MAGTTGLEPATSAVTGQRSDQLSYVPRVTWLPDRFPEMRFSLVGLFHITGSALGPHRNPGGRGALLLQQLK